MRVATDVGGTFTDLVYVDDEGIHVAKASTTPPHFERGLLRALDDSGLDGSKVESFAHGTTVVINALLSRRGARTALVTTAGFRDVLEIARGNRPDLFNFAFAKPRPFVPRSRRFEVDERIDYRGQGRAGRFRTPLSRNWPSGSTKLKSRRWPSASSMPT